MADGSAHTIESSETLLGHPSIHADKIIQHDKRVILDSNQYVDKLVNFVFPKQFNCLEK